MAGGSLLADEAVLLPPPPPPCLWRGRGGGNSGHAMLGTATAPIPEHSEHFPSAPRTPVTSEPLPCRTLGDPLENIPCIQRANTHTRTHTPTHTTANEHSKHPPKLATSPLHGINTGCVYPTTIPHRRDDARTFLLGLVYKMVAGLS